MTKLKIPILPLTKRMPLTKSEVQINQSQLVVKCHQQATLLVRGLLGTGRKGRQSEKVANYLLAQAKKFGFDSQLFDVRDYAGPFTVPYWEPEDKDDKWRKTMKSSHGLIIVVPEYNHGYPGELKIMLDKLYEEYNRKPVGIAAVSAGPFSGTRVIQSLKPVLLELQMVPIFANTHFGNVEKLFDQQGKMIDDAYGKRLGKMFEEIKWYAEKLK